MLVDAVTWGVGLVVGVPAHNEEVNVEGHHGVVPVVAGDNWVESGIIPRPSQYHVFFVVW